MTTKRDSGLTDLIELLAALDLTDADLAATLHVTTKCVSFWRKETSKLGVPRYVFVALRAIAALPPDIREDHLVRVSKRTLAEAA